MVKTAALVGAVVCAASLLASLMANFGLTPPWAFERFGQLGQFTLRQHWFGVPLAYYGLAWFLLVWGCTRAPARARLILPVLAASAVLVSGYLLWLAWALGSRTWIGWPLAGAALIVTIWAWLRVDWGLVAWGREGVGVLRTAATEPRTRARLVFLVSLALLPALTWNIAARRTDSDVARSRVFASWYDTKKAEAVEANRAAIQVLAYTDYQCQFCAAGVPRARALVQALAAERQTPIQLQISHYPFGLSCNPTIANDRHPAACEAAIAVLAAQRSGVTASIEDLEDRFYAKGSQLTTRDVADILAEVGVPPVAAELRASLEREVATIATEAYRLGVRGTPSFVVDGVLLPGGASMLEAALRYEIDRRQGRVRR